jgi:ribonuclease HI
LGVDVVVYIYVDGAAKGNPGKSGIGVIIRDDKGKVLAEISKYIGVSTNNVAEYTALIFGLQEALILKATGVLVYSDSELMVNQLNGRYKVKDPGLKRLNLQIDHLRRGFKEISFEYISREENKEADRLAVSGVESV